ncbi:PaaI family thioesterase [Qipengyuania sp. 1XM1-15A]|uniref:PaaI family thioesterase n=1 Tax=Qipengyuania xiamenensis TaxID=2867237 RepID=UPI001C88BFBA|nr:PaaI family thioesterase [Qipengyuania xiamenensis]MBX7532344.1 PaaI family thioesterase [Qipengyuania xiamenensis]
MARIYESQRSPSAELMGSEFVSFDEERGELTTRYTPPPSFASPRGAVQGGLIAGFLDEVMGGALLAVTETRFGEEGIRLPLNLDMKLTFVRMVSLDTITAKGRVVRVGKRVAFLEGELFDREGNLLARATSTALPTPVPGKAE